MEEPQAYHRRLGPRASCAAVAADWLVPAIVAATSLTKLRSPDLWWHLKIGELLWTHGGVPATEPFASTSQGPWHPMDLGAEVLLHGVDRALGPVGLSLLGFLLVLLAGRLVGALAARAVPEGLPRALPAALAVALWGAASQFRLFVQPHLFSVAALPAVLCALEWGRTPQGARGSRGIWETTLLFVLVAVWANLHRAAVLAPLAAVLVGLGAWPVGDRARVWRAARLGLTSSAALFCTPAGVRLVTSAFEVAAMQGEWGDLGEWRSMDLGFLLSEMPVLAGSWVVFALAAIARRRLDGLTVLAVLLSVAAATNLRLVPDACVAMAPTLAWGASVALARGLAPRPRRGPIRRVVVGWALAAGLVVVPFVARFPLALWGVGIARAHVPIDAASFLRRTRPPGRLWNSFNFGGYLVYAVAPEPKVFIDGRGDTVYGRDHIRETLRANQDSAALHAQLERFDVDVVMLETLVLGEPRYAWLRADRRWRIVYWDDLALVAVREGPRTAAYLRAHGYPALDYWTALDRLLDPAADPDRAALDADVVRNAVEAPRSVRARYFAALAHRNAGREAAYRREREVVARLASERGLSLPLP